MKGGLQMRATKVVTVSLPPSLLKDTERLAKEERRTRSELFREALREYIATRRWRRTRRWGEAAARRTGVRDEADVERIVEDYRRRAK
jgi:CopG family transcriptional regulator/antitoxin EndoAI